MTLIDKAALLNRIATEVHYDSEHSLEMYAKLLSEINTSPTVDAEPTEEQVEKYCRERCLVVVTSELFNEMKARWSAEPVRHGHWIEQDGYDGDVYYDCSVCGNSWTTIDGTPQDNGMNYCPHCGAKMDEVTDE